ncbi:lactadherin-like [Amphiura filiformis]|uniref:lactadherin-like n=1 Tax=Amphiura filiformis TaxID=82378 RepID=UPI003B20EE92
MLIHCQDKLGVEDGNITDDQLQASSDLSNGTGLLQWRLNQEAVTGMPGAWVALISDTQPWIQVNLYRHTHIAGVIVQGRTDAEQWVTSYKVKTSLDADPVLYDFVKDKDGAEEVGTLI